MKVLGSTKSKINTNENVPYLEITDAVLVHCNIVNNNYQQKLRDLYTFFPIKSLGQLLDISPKNLNLLNLLNISPKFKTF